MKNPVTRARRGNVSLLASALAFACATGYNSVVSVQASLPGAPLGIQVPLSVRRGILVGWGSAVAAPWPMPVAALVAASRRWGRAGAQRAALLCAGIGTAGIVGILIEPNTYRMRRWTPPVRRAALAHAVTCVALALAGRSRHRRLLAGD